MYFLSHVIILKIFCEGTCQFVLCLVSVKYVFYNETIYFRWIYNDLNVWSIIGKLIILRMLLTEYRQLLKYVWDQILIYLLCNNLIYLRRLYQCFLQEVTWGPSLWWFDFWCLVCCVFTPKSPNIFWWILAMK